jgi:non-ribosomal peptide synthetase component E (peptide arylation enzyme)
VIEASTFWDLVVARAAATPDALLAVDEGGRRLTFAALRDGSERAAGGLAALGVREDAVVSWQLPNRLETIVLAAALARLGAIQNPIPVSSREREVGFIVDQLEPALLILPPVWRGFDHPALGELLRANHPGLHVLVVDDELPAAPAGADAAPTPAPPAPLEPAEQPVRWVLYTSGTTSDPKGVRHTDASLLVSSRNIAQAMHMRADDRNTLVFPFAHIGGLEFLMADLLVGSASIVIERFGPHSIDVLAREGVTLAGSGTPFQRVYLEVQRASDARLFPAIRAFPGGGATRPPGLHRELVEAFGAGLLSGYGLTEVGSFSMADLDDPDDVKATTEGRPYPGTEIRIVRVDGSIAGPGEQGEIRGRGPQLMRGYVDAALDAAAFDDDGFFRTGDLGYLDERGYLHVTGRIKDVIIRKGENISAREVEDLLYLHPDIHEAAVVALPDPLSGERACAVVVMVDGAGPVTVDGLRAFLDGKGLARYKAPEQVEIVEELPKSSIGKVQKGILQARFAPDALTGIARSRA